MPKDVVLKNGRIVSHKLPDHGSVEWKYANSIAFMADGGEMSDSEWNEYCDVLKDRTAKAFPKKKKNNWLKPIDSK